jgi:signal peptide peptidase SppA
MKMNLDLSDFQKGKGWMILPAAFDDLSARLKSPIDLESAENKQSISLFKSRTEIELYSVSEGVAVIPISGPIMKKDSFLTWLFGGTSYEYIRAAFSQAVSDDEVDSIILRIDSPGGVVSGVEETGDLIFASRGEKPVIAYNEGQMMSAAYWLGSAADVIYSSKTAGAGSIGVLMIHEDWSRYNERIGIKVSYLTAGKYKALGNPDEPLTEIAREKFQAELDFLYSIFVNTVARNRDAEESSVLSNMADGKIFIGQQSVDAGLVDGIANFNEVALIAAGMAEDEGRKTFEMGAKTMENVNTIEELIAQYPDLVKQIQDDAKADLNQAIQLSADNERERIMDLALARFGETEGEKFRAIVDSGITLDQFQATMAVVEPPADGNSIEADSVNDAKAQMLEVIENAGAENPGFDSNSMASEADYMTLVKAYQKENRCSMFEAQMAVSRKNPEARQKYIQSVN